ncbi:hypothetical protein ACN2AU_10225 [Aerococcus viridans]
MFKILGLQIELLRKRFSIYGFFNISSLLIVLALLVIGIKGILHFILKDYFIFSLLLFLVINLLGLLKMYPSDTDFKRYINYSSLFPSLGLNKIKSFFVFYKYLMFSIIIVYLLFPINLEEKNIIIFFSALILSYMISFIYSFLCYKSNYDRAEGFITSVKIIAAIFLALYSRGFIPINLESVILRSNMYILLVILLVLIFINIIILEERRKK